MPRSTRPAAGSRRALAFTGAWVAAALLAALPATASAQGDRDYLLRTPIVTLGFHAGLAAPRAGSDIFDFTRRELTVERSDFLSAGWGANLGIRATDRLEVAVDFTVADTEIRSEMRDWIGSDDLPIVQETRFERRPVTVSVKGYLADRGRSISRFAWIPTRWAPYLGAGAGIMWYTFEQEGEFVDIDTVDDEAVLIFEDRFHSSGSTPTVHVLAGVDLSLGPRFLLTAEGRYLWASDALGPQFDGFDDIDLAGFHATAGIAVRF
jgi:hypothetical protein